MAKINLFFLKRRTDLVYLILCYMVQLQTVWFGLEQTVIKPSQQDKTFTSVADCDNPYVPLNVSVLRFL